MALVWPEGGPAGLLRYLGRADLRFVREERRGGRRALRFEAGGPAFGTRGGPIWFDAAEGHILEAAWGIPNHSEHCDFLLRLTGVSDGGGGMAAPVERAFRELPRLSLAGGGRSFRFISKRTSFAAA